MCTLRLSQNALKNIFGQTRLRQIISNALQFRQLLKNISAIQCFKSNYSRGSYTVSSDQNLLGIRDLPASSNAVSSAVSTVSLPRGWNNYNQAFCIVTQNCLYNVAGYILARIRRNLKCVNCLQAIIIVVSVRDWDFLTVEI